MQKASKNLESRLGKQMQKTSNDVESRLKNILTSLQSSVKKSVKDTQGLRKEFSTIKSAHFDLVLTSLCKLLPYATDGSNGDNKEDIDVDRNSTLSNGSFRMFEEA